MNFCFHSWLRTLQWAQNEIQASVSFYTVRECATDKEMGSQYLIPESWPSLCLHYHYLSLKGWWWGGAFRVCYQFAGSEMSERENRCFNEVMPTVENREFKIHFISQLSLIWLISNLKSSTIVCASLFLSLLMNMECKALICFSKKNNGLEERGILKYSEHYKVQEGRVFLPDIFVLVRCFLLFLILSPWVKTLLREKLFFWFWEILLNSSCRPKSAV